MAKPVSELKIPATHELILIDTKGGKVLIKSTYGKPGQEIKLEVDPFTHPAWKRDGGKNINAKVDQVVKFQERNKAFAGHLDNFFGAPKEESAAA